MHFESAEHFNEIVDKYEEIPIVIDFWAEWCGPCKMFGPVFEKAMEKWGDKFIFAKLDTESLPGLAQTFQVTGIPMISFIKGKKEVHRQAGALRRGQFDQLLTAVLEALEKMENPPPL
ncbi:MAG: thioredoxin fold domain-containing protein [archaeon]|nr:thioredoxin fold domain-containing protein [archaeon]